MEVTLENNQGNYLKVQITEYQEGDELGLISCIRDEYGDTYFKQSFYDPSYIAKTAKEGSITFLVAKTEENMIIGMMVLKQFFPEESMCEIASLILRKHYRGYGLAMEFFKYGMGILMSRSYSAALCLPVLFHHVTQKLLYLLGLRVTGLILNVFDIESVTHSYPKDRNDKHSQGIQIRAMEKQNAGVIYLPYEHRNYCRSVYESLGVSYVLGEETPICNLEKNGELSIIEYRNDERQSSLEIRIHSVGDDLENQILLLHKLFPLKKKQTAGIFLNSNDSRAVWAYRILVKLGYFFSGLRPLCGEKEYMVLHNPGDVEIFFEDYDISGEFFPVVDYIRNCYFNRYLGAKESEK